MQSSVRCRVSAIGNDVAVNWGDVPTWIQTAVVVAAGILALIQLRRADDSRRIHRVLEAHHDITTGDVGVARDKLSPIIRSGSVCRRVAFDEFERAEVESGKSATSCVVVVVRAFERAWESYEHGRLDRRMAQRLLASTTAWWSIALSKVTSDQLHGIDALRSLESALDPDGAFRRRHLETDFRPSADRTELP